MSFQRERLDRRLTELERKSGAVHGIRVIMCPREMSDGAYQAWRREHVELHEQYGQVIVVRFVSPGPQNGSQLIY